MLIEFSAASAVLADECLAEWLSTQWEAGRIVDAVVATTGQQRERFWRIREDWAVDRERPGGLWFDVSVPLSAVADYVSRLFSAIYAHDPSLSVFVIGHLADGNLHFTINAAQPISDRYEEIAPMVTDGLSAIGGSYSAEHGIGLEKKATLERLVHPTKRRLMQGIKALLDPHGILNPGKVIPR
jgi:FAD/FMN-containing dehydrogenase